MGSTAALAYFAAGSILFFFWAYGIVSFALDLKNKLIPGLHQYFRGRKQLKEERREQEERNEKERQLY